MKTYKGPAPKPLPHQHLILGATSERRIGVIFKLAEKTPDIEYIIPYSANTYALPGDLTPPKLAYMFAVQPAIPGNILLEESFAALIEEEKKKLQP